ncbi:cation:proton antiporter regulatory subunit [Micromonospora violae]|uniref:cation:proton antiporter regulatory subunit n=1 Tax=Micromonospora violae TaxID=1278207 RepID=UPI00102BAD87|nr:TrkA C-terminal domain-containing protein [Micromonospora violae]
MEIERITLPSVGVSYSFVTGDGTRLGVICHPNGARDIALYDRDDPADTRAAVALSPLEAHHLVSLLDATPVVDLMADSDADLAAVTVAQVPIPAGGDFDGRPLRSLRSDAAVVAIVRDGHLTLNPDGGWTLRYGDTLIAVGTRDAIDHLAHVVAGYVTGGMTPRKA